MGSRQKSGKKLLRRFAKRNRKMNRLKFLFSRDGGKCFWCKKDLILPPFTMKGGNVDRVQSDRFVTLDHVNPKKRGGKNVVTNLVICCQDCNNIKGSSLLNPVTKMPISPSVISTLLK